MNCQFETISDNVYKCKVCGYEIKINQDPKKIFHTCMSDRGIIDKVIDVTKTVGNWVAHGAPITTKIDKEERKRICESCENYANEKCKICSCYMPLKILMETSHCPVGKW